MTLDLPQLAELSHELKTPLVAIDGFARILEEQGAELSNKDRLEFLNIIRSNSKKLERILDLWMDAARLDEKQIAVNLETVDLGATLADTIQEYSILAKERGLSVTQTKPAQPLLAHTDSLRVSQILTNLLSNALKYTEKGVVTVRFESKAGRALIHVKDSGIGMDAADAGKVFDRYFRTESSKDKAQGHGLGLYIAQQIARALDGEVSVKSEKGQGTEFTLSLPTA